MTDHDREMRTIIVCFVVAVFSLTALRFVEINNFISASSIRILGASTEKRITLPNAEVKETSVEVKFIGSQE